MRRLALLLAACFAVPAGAQAPPGFPAPGFPAPGFPERPIRLVIPFTPGVTNDIVGRLVTDGMAARLGQSFVTENRGGAGGMLGAEVVARATPDGYTVLLGGSGSLTITSLVHPRLPYDTNRPTR